LSHDDDNAQWQDINDDDAQERTTKNATCDN